MKPYCEVLLPIILSFLSLSNNCNNTIDPYKTKLEVNYEQLRKEFQHPPSDAKMRTYWWWLNSNLTKKCITQDLEAMKQNGYGGAIIFDAGSSEYSLAKKTKAGPTFLSEDWLKLYAHAISEADRLGLEMSINIVSGWNPGGPSITPEYALKTITFSDTILSGPGKINITLPQPKYNNLYEDLIVQAVRICPDFCCDNLGIKNFELKALKDKFGWGGVYPLYKLREEYDECNSISIKDDILDVTSFYKDEIFTWEIPVGDWTIIRYGMTNTGMRVSTASDGWDGFAMDHLNKKALLHYNNDAISKLIQVAKSTGNSLKYLHTDSWEMGIPNWTNNFIEEFHKRNGYNMTPFMPVLTNRVVNSREVSNRFLRDYRRTVADLVVEEFYQTLSDIAHRNNLYTHPQSSGPYSAPIDGIQTMKFNDVPNGEFWGPSEDQYWGNDGVRFAVKQSASVAHIYGKRFVAAEGLTNIGPHWERPPKDCKNAIDRAFCSGVNRIYWQTYTASPDEYGEPGNEFFADNHLNRHTTWWDESKALVEYINRSSSLLSKGMFKADALYYYGDDTPNFVFLKEEVTDLGKGYDWDKCSFDVLLNNVNIVNNRIVLPDGMNYSILVLPNEKTIKFELLRKLEELVRKGMIIVGPKPEKASGLKNYPQSDIDVKTIASRMWGNIDGKIVTYNTLEKGKVFWGKTPEEVLKILGIQPDFEFQSKYSDTHLDYIHRYTNSEDIYFVANRLAYHGNANNQYSYRTDIPNRYEEVLCKFKVVGKIPELWNPMTGEIFEIAVYHEENGYTIMPLHFNPDGSLFIVFRDKKQKKHITKIEKDDQSIFPAIDNEVYHLPSFAYYRKHEKGNRNKVSVTIVKDGEYVLYWSDGTVTTLNESSSNINKPLDLPWKLKFLNSWGPEDALLLDSLMSWTEFDDKRIKYYSGSAFYSNTFSLNQHEITNKKIYIDLGNVQEIASLIINDIDVGTSWISPFVYEVTPYIKTGENNIQVKVTNSWVNLLIGDSYQPSEKRNAQTNIVKFERENKETYLRESGLIGQVKLILITNRYLN